MAKLSKSAEKWYKQINLKGKNVVVLGQPSKSESEWLSKKCTIIRLNSASAKSCNYAIVYGMSTRSQLETLLEVLAPNGIIFFRKANANTMLLGITGWKEISTPTLQAFNKKVKQ
jgi:hypothetical protein